MSDDGQVLTLIAAHDNRADCEYRVAIEPIVIMISR